MTEKSVLSNLAVFGNVILYLVEDLEIKPGGVRDNMCRIPEFNINNKNEIIHTPKVKTKHNLQLINNVHWQLVKNNLISHTKS